MAGVYTLGVRSASLTAAGNLVDIVSPASPRARIKELGIFVGVAGASPTIGISRVSAIGTRTSPVLGQAEDANDPAAATGMATAWSVAPTVSTTYLRRVTLPATLGAGVIWSWPTGQEIELTASLGVMVSLIALSSAVATAVDVYASWIE